jgi:hypothetical protein
MPIDAPVQIPPADKPKVSDAQCKRAYAIARNAGLTDADFKAVVQSFGFSSSKEITKDVYESLCAKLQGGK